MNNQEVIVLPGWHGAALEVGEMPSPFVFFLQLLEQVQPKLRGLMLTELETPELSGVPRVESEGLQILDNTNSDFQQTWSFNDVPSIVAGIEYMRPVSTTPVALLFARRSTRDAWLNGLYRDPLTLEVCSASSFANYAEGIDGCLFAVFADVFEYSVNTAFLWHRSDFDLTELPIGTLHASSADIARNCVLGTDWSPEDGQIMPPDSLAANLERWQKMRR